jgi:phage/plasmid primase-like uncharacterized protein
MSAGTFEDLRIEIKAHGSNEQRPPCPECGGIGAFSVDIRDGRFNCFKCGFHGRAGNDVDYRPVVRIDDPAVAERKRERLRRTWKATLPLNHADARAPRAYLESRALSEILSAPPPVLRAHPSLEYWDGGKSCGKYPAMVALFHAASGQAVTLHVTYLRHDGCAKANVPSPKKILGVAVKGSTRGGAIHLHEPHHGILGIAEGIESALSLHLLQKIPVWSSFCADNLKFARLPKGLRELYVGVDLDASHKGEEVATALVSRIRQFSPSIKLYTVKPEIDGPGDLNDELRRRAYGRR